MLSTWCPTNCLRLCHVCRPACRGMYELGSYASLGMQRQGLGMSPSTLYDGSNGMVHVCAMLAGEWVVMMLLAWYLEQVWPI